jgi:uncharacterized protein (TIGR02284 family)
MITTDKNVVRALGHLYKIVEAGERGYISAAAGVKNRAIKMLFKSYAQRRAEFKEEIFVEMQHWGATTRPPGSILGAIHRGRVTIFAAMTIGEENIERVVLKEVLFGERIAKLTYERTLRQRLPDDTHAMVQRQYEEILRLLEQVQNMFGKNGKRLVVRMYDTKEAADEAIFRLMTSEYPSESIKKRSVVPLEIYTGSGPKVIETVLSGAVGGVIWGGISGLLSAGTMLELSRYGQTVLVPSPFSPLQLAIVAVLGLSAAGIFIGGSIGFFLGLGVKDEDTYFYNQSVLHGRILVEVLTDASRASPAWHLLAHVNMEARAGAR